jgi:hypothetical protein
MDNIFKNSHCYIFEKKNYNLGILDDFVDATYIITMINSHRNNNIKEQLKKIIPTKIIYIVHNQGYKNCHKILPEQSSDYDLIDANLNVMNHSINNNYNNILILEDDFIFNDKFNDKNIIKEIENLFTKKDNDEFYFNLGPITYLFYPHIFFFNNIYRGIIALCTQGIIYNKKIKESIIKKNINIGYDIFLSLNYENYFYKIPLCYQTFPITENQNNWLNSLNCNYCSKIILFITQFIIKLLKLDIQPEPGFTIIYTTMFIIHYLILFIFIYLIIKLLPIQT